MPEDILQPPKPPVDPVAGPPPREFGLGRLPAPDPRDMQYRLQMPEKPSIRRSRYWMSRGKALDQGDSSMCVAYATGKYLTADPIRNKLPNLEELYHDCQLNDEWPGEDYDGTSVRAAFKVLKARGLVSEYRWATDVDTIVEHILKIGPVVMGTSWFRDMFTPTREGYITPSGVNDGGHSYLLIGASRDKENPENVGGGVGAVRVLNSWGDRWADRGRAWMTFEHLGRLLAMGGEAAVAREVRPNAV